MDWRAIGYRQAFSVAVTSDEHLIAWVAVFRLSEVVSRRYPVIVLWRWRRAVFACWNRRLDPVGYRVWETLMRDVYTMAVLLAW